MKKLTCALLVAALAAPGVVLAGPGGTSCATAEEIFPGQTYSGNTSGAGYSDVVGAVGPLPSPANDAIYKFTSNGQATTAIQFTGSYAWGIYLTTGCSGTAPSPLEAWSGTAGESHALIIDDGAGGALTAGTTYYVIVTGNPAGSASDNGAFTFTTPSPLPVSLQNFSVE